MIEFEQTADAEKVGSIVSVYINTNNVFKEKKRSSFSVKICDHLKAGMPIVCDSDHAPITEAVHVRKSHKPPRSKRLMPLA